MKSRLDQILDAIQVEADRIPVVRDDYQAGVAEGLLRAQDAVRGLLRG